MRYNSSNGYTVMRNLNGGTMRGYINKDGTGLLRDDKGNFHSVNTQLVGFFGIVPAASLWGAFGEEVHGCIYCD